MFSNEVVKSGEEGIDGVFIAGCARSHEHDRQLALEQRTKPVARIEEIADQFAAQDIDAQELPIMADEILNKRFSPFCFAPPSNHFTGELFKILVECVEWTGLQLADSPCVRREIL